MAEIQGSMVKKLTSMFDGLCGGTTRKFFVKMQVISGKVPKTTFRTTGMIELEGKPSKELEQCMTTLIKIFHEEMRKGLAEDMTCIISEKAPEKADIQNNNDLDPEKFYKPVGFDCAINEGTSEK